MTAINANARDRRMTPLLKVLALVASNGIALMLASGLGSQGAPIDPRHPAQLEQQPYDPFADEFNTELRGLEHLSTRYDPFADEFNTELRSVNQPSRP